MNFTVNCWLKGRRFVYRYYYRDESDVPLQTVLSHFQQDFLSAGLHPADVTFLEIFNHSARQMTRINAQFVAAQPLYFDGRLGK